MSTVPAHPFADLIGLHFREGGHAPGRSECYIDVAPAHLNPHGVVHGGVLFSMADTGMGKALYPSLAEGELCATIEIRIAYHRAVSEGRIVCDTRVVSRGKRIAHLESDLMVDGALVARAVGSYSIFAPTRR